MKKRTLLSMAMVATMMMSTFVGCGGGRDGATDTSSAETATETTEASQVTQIGLHTVPYHAWPKDTYTL